MNPRPVLLDCTLRDGGYHVAWDFSPDLVADYLTAMATVQVDRVEIGFRTLRTGEFMGGHGFSTDGFIRQFDLPEGVGIGVLPVATVRDAVESGSLVRLTLEEPLPPMIYDAIWRSANYPSFCASVARLAKQCATDYAQDHGKLSSPASMKGYVDT